ncbi:MAG TPA: tetratricopeptide repeat protein [Candidatus Acidoferrales bacterium]|nr:tetratricopeptide repeat protein [Candidatus Acidoferrales bacterium]
MRTIRLLAVVLAVLLGLVSCSRDPNVVKKHYYESGNKYFDKGRYKEASIQYRNALKQDPKYGPAHYKLGLTFLKVPDIGGAVNSFRRALDTLPQDSPDRWDTMVRLSEIYLQLGRGEKPYMDQVKDFTDAMLKRDPNSFDGHRLVGDWNYARATAAYRDKHPDEGVKFLDAAIAEYRRADQIKPGQTGVVMQLAHSLSAKNEFDEAEKLYRSVIASDKTYQYVYGDLYRMYLYRKQPDQGEQVLKLAYQNNPKQYGFLTLLAIHYSAQRRTADMIKVLDQIKAHAKDYPDAYITVGNFYLRMGDGDTAIREFKDGMAKDPKRKATYQKYVIEVLMRQGKKQDAAAVNDEILKANPSDNDARGLAATFLLDKGDVAKALAELQAVVTRAPDNPVARFNLGRAHAARGEWEQARQQFMKAIELKSEYLIARLALAQLQIQRNEFDAALKTAEGILQIDRGNVNARLLESAALMGQKKFAESRAILEAMLKANPSFPDALYQLGVVNLAENKYQAAQDAFRRSYELNPANARGLMGMVETQIAQGKTDDALKLLQDESAKAPNRLDLLLAVGNTAVRAGKYDYAIETFNKVLAGLDKTPEAAKARGDLYLRIGETYRRKGDLNNAVQALQKSRETLPDNIAVLSTLALVLDGAGRRLEARQVYEATLRLDPNNAVSLNNLAFLLAESGGDLDDALTKAQRAKQLQPNLYEISDTLGWIYLKKNLSEQAIDIFKDLVNKQPDHSTYHFHLGMAYSQKGDRTKAMEQLKEALKYNPGKEEKDKIQQLITKLG